MACQAPAINKNGACECPDRSYFVTSTNADGTQRTSITCERCPEGSYAKTFPDKCEACPNPNMQYDTTVARCKCKDGYRDAGQNFCVTDAYYSQLTNSNLVPPNKDKVTFYSMVNSKGPLEPFTLNSDVFEQFYVDAAVGCKYENSPQACQTLANLCVLQLYNEQTTACQLFKTIVRDETTQSAL